MKFLIFAASTLATANSALAFVGKWLPLRRWLDNKCRLEEVHPLTSFYCIIFLVFASIFNHPHGEQIHNLKSTKTATSNHPARASSSPITATTTKLDATATTLHEKFTTLQPAFAPDINPVAAGGWYNIEQNMGNPKDDLVSLIVQGLSQDSSKVEFQTNTEQVEALVAVLYAYGQGFDADLVEGDWKLVFSLQGRKSPKFQKVVGTQETAGKTDNTFDTHRMTFSGDATILKKGTIGSTVKVRA